MRRILPWLLVSGAFACSAAATDGPGASSTSSSGANGEPGAPDASVDARVDASPDATPDAAPDGSGPTEEPMVALQSSFTTLYAMSDVHAHLAQLETLLVAASLVDAASTFPTDVRWTGGDATLVLTGDLIDKGPSSLGTLEAVRALQTAGNSAGGHVLVLLGNHEAEFFADPTDDKFMGEDRIDHELAEQIPPISPAAFASGSTPLSAWLRSRPVAARIGTWFFSHGGNTQGRSPSELDAAFRTARSGALGFADPVFVGDDSLLEAQEWYETAAVVPAALAALGVKRIAFGHDPGAFGEHGRLLVPAAHAGALVKLDTGLGNEDSAGELLRVRVDGPDEVVEAIAPSGAVREMNRQPTGS